MPAHNSIPSRISLDKHRANYAWNEAVLSSQYILSNPRNFCDTVYARDAWQVLTQYGSHYDETGDITYVGCMVKVDGQDWRLEDANNGARYLLSVESPVDGDKVKVWEERDFSTHDHSRNDAEPGRVMCRGVTITRKDGTQVYMYDSQDDIQIYNPNHPHDVEYAFKPKNDDDVQVLKDSGWTDMEVDEFRRYTDFLDNWKEKN